MSGRVNTVMTGLRGSFKNWRPTRKIESGRLEDLRAHYSKLSKKYRFEVAIPLETMKRESTFHSASNIEERWQIASNIVNYALAKTPSDADEFIEMVNELVKYGSPQGSARLLSYVCEQLPEHSKCVE